MSQRKHVVNRKGFDHLITVWINNHERQLLDAIIEADGSRNMSATFRRFIREEARRFGITPPLSEHPIVPESSFGGELVID